jgi:hypothetical protein
MEALTSLKREAVTGLFLTFRRSFVKVPPAVKISGKNAINNGQSRYATFGLASVRRHGCRRKIRLRIYIIFNI